MFRENFPKATDSTLVETSPETKQYNCIAWTLGETDVWYDSAEGYYWPPRVPKPASNPSHVVELYRRQGFTQCESTSLEDGIEKIAIYTSPGGKFQHAAYQMQDGRWTSKFGPYEDAAHDTAERLLGLELQSVFAVMKRPRQKRTFPLPPS